MTALMVHLDLGRSNTKLLHVLASLADIAVVTSMAVSGLLMAALPPTATVGLFVTTIVFVLVLDAIKVTVFDRVRID